MKTPVILLAFANEHPDNTGYLRDLPKEMGQLQKIVEKAEEKGLCELVLRPNIDVKTLIETIRKHRQELSILLYSGHATSFELLLRESDELQSIHGEGLVPLIGQLPALKLVFLNGCTTAKLAQSLVQEGIPAVIGTYQVVEDTTATALSIAFFEEFLSGNPLDLSWRNAISILKTTKKQKDFYRDRGVVKRESSLELPFPWDLFYADNHLPSIKNWNIGLASNNNLLGLPSIPIKKKGFPNTPYRFLDRYRHEDAPIFFGRNQEIGELYYKIQDSNAPLILFYGQSGVGKSSILEAGLIPRIQQEQAVYFIRRIADKGLKESFLIMLKDAFTIENLNTREDLLTFLLNQQNSTQKQLFILDQVEEAFTRQLGEQSGTAELHDFLQFVQPILTNNELQLTLMLIFRKEFLADIKNQVASCAINITEVFIERLSKKGIIEVVNGLASTSALQSKYQLNIESDLDIEIADDLLVDANSPIAPILQIILSELWKDQPNPPRKFTKEQYRILKSKGILLDNFFQQQMVKIRQWKATVKEEIANSGLALDVLNYHTTDFGTSESRDLESLRKQYEHQADVLDELLKQLNQNYLLTNYQEQIREQATGKNKQIEKSGLAHDTLAPIVQKEIRYSDKPGPRALRILESKAKEYAINDRIYLEEEDLTLVEVGKNGMRIWTSKEQELIEKSRLIRGKRQKNRQKNRLFASIATILILGLGVYSWWSAIQQEKISRSALLMTQGEMMLNKNPTQALPLMEKANEIYPQQAYLEKIAQVKRNYAFYDSLNLNQGLNLTAISSDGHYLIFTNPNKASDAILYNLKAKKIIKTLDDARNNLNHLQFSPDGSILVLAGEDRRIYVYQVNGQMIQILNQENSLPNESAIIEMAFSEDGQYLASIHKNKELNLWQYKNNFKKILRLDLKETPTTVALGKAFQIFVGYANGQVCQYNFAKKKKWCWENGVNSISNLDYKNEQLLVSHSNGFDILNTDSAKLEIPTKFLQYKSGNTTTLNVKLAPEPPTIFSWNQSLVQAKFAFNTDYVLVQGAKIASLIDLKGNEGEMVLDNLSGHTNNLVDIHLIEETKEVYTSAVDGKLFPWDLATDFPIQELSWEKDDFFRLLAGPSNGSHFLTSRGTQIQYWSTADLNQPKLVSDIHQKQILALYLSADEQTGVSAQQNKIVLWQITDNGFEVKAELAIKGRKKVQHLALDATNNNVLFSYRRGNDLYLWDGQTEEVIPLKGHRNTIKGIEYLPSESKALSIASDSLAIIWDIPTKTMVQSFIHPEKNLISIFYTDEVNQFFTATYGNFYLWDMENRSYAVFPKLENANINTLQLGNDNLYLGTTQGMKKVIFKQNYSSILHLKNIARQVNVSDFLVKDEYLITKNQEGSVEAWQY